MKNPGFQDWDQPSLALLSATPRAFPDEIFVRLERRGWKVVLKTSSMDDCFTALRRGEFSILVVHDTPELPASFILRSQIVDPFAIITPTIVLCHPDHDGEEAYLKEIGQPELVRDGLNPAAFIGAFEWLLRRWSQGSLGKLYQARKLYLTKQYRPFSQLLTMLKTQSELAHLVTPCIAQLLLRQDDYRGVEKLLLDGLQKHPRNIGIIANLIELYLHAAMPETALKVLAAARKNHGSIRLLYPDQIQAHLMLNQVKECIPLLESLIRENYSGAQAQKFLARCLYSEGQMEAFHRSINTFDATEDLFKNSWNRTAS